MATTIVTKYGSDAPAASNIVRGELAVDTENGRLYTENSSGAVVDRWHGFTLLFGRGSTLPGLHLFGHTQLFAFAASTWRRRVRVEAPRCSPRAIRRYWRQLQN